MNIFNFLAILVLNLIIFVYAIGSILVALLFALSVTIGTIFNSEYPFIVFGNSLEAYCEGCSYLLNLRDSIPEFNFKKQK